MSTPVIAEKTTSSGSRPISAQACTDPGIRRRSGVRRGGVQVELVAVPRDEGGEARSSLAAEQDVRVPPAAPTDLAMPHRAADRPARAVVGPAVGLGPQSMDDRHLLLEHVE